MVFLEDDFIIQFNFSHKIFEQKISKFTFKLNFLESFFFFFVKRYFLIQIYIYMFGIVRLFMLYLYCKGIDYLNIPFGKIKLSTYLLFFIDIFLFCFEKRVKQITYGIFYFCFNIFNLNALLINLKLIKMV